MMCLNTRMQRRAGSFPGRLVDNDVQNIAHAPYRKWIRAANCRGRSLAWQLDAKPKPAVIAKLGGVQCANDIPRNM